MRLQELSWTEVRDEEFEIAILPVGSTEQHGPHNPVGVDSIVACRFAEGAAERTDAVLLPSIDVGIAEHHREFEGTLYVTHDTLRDYVQETLKSLSRHGIERVVVVNGHGGNSAALEEACARLTRDGDLYAVCWEWFNTRGESVSHGGKYETAIMQYLEPELVSESGPSDTDSWGKSIKSAKVAYDTHDFTDTGFAGDVSEATPELGEKMFEESLDDLVELVEWITDTDLPSSFNE